MHQPYNKVFLYQPIYLSFIYVVKNIFIVIFKSINIFSCLTIDFIGDKKSNYILKIK
jgi:hypothetical protein